jgi:paraquat-inducible protein B
MNQQPIEEMSPSGTAQAVVRTKKGISIVWVVPLVAILIGGWLAYKAITEKGPSITITFETAEGLEAGKTKIKYKDVEVGKVESINVSEDLTHIVVTAELVKGAKQYLTENTRFWVVRPRVVAGEVSGLGTLFSGAYIGVDPGKSGAPARNFKGLEIPPVVTGDQPGRHFALRAQRLGSLDIGSPIYYRQIKVGQVVGYELEEDKKTIRFRVFIDAPHHELVRENTKFWNAAGVDVDISAEGIQVQMESLASLLLGGIAFDVPTNLASGGPAQEDQVFILYSRHEDILEIKTAEMHRWILEFEGSVRGLSVGAPVEFKGIKFGEVTHIMAEFDMETLSPRIRVFIATEPEVFEVVGDETRISEVEKLEKLVEKGMRAQLKTGSLLTGHLFVDLDFHPDAPPAQIKYDGVYPELPTVPAPLEEITKSVTKIVDKLDQIPLEQIGNDLRDTMAHLNKSTEQLQKLMQNINEKVAPAATATLEKTETTLTKVGRLLDAESPTGYELKRALSELANAAHNINLLADYLERHPESLVYGKEKSQ